MKRLFVNPLRKLTWIALFGMVAVACQDNDADQQISAEQAKAHSKVTVADNNEIIAATQEAMEITSGVFADEGISDGRASTGGKIARGGHKDDHGCQPDISGSFDIDRGNNRLVYTGSLTIDYGDGSSCDSDHVRMGKITDSFTYTLTWGDSTTFNSVETITFEGFTKDGVRIDGTFIITSAKGKSKTIEARGARITYSDGTSANWDGILSYTYDRGEYCKWKDNEIHVSGSLTGNNREGTAFTWRIKEDLIFKYKCDKHHRFRPVGGTVDVMIGGIVSTIDYGDGSCDKTYTVTSNGETTEIEFEGRDD